MDLEWKLKLVTTNPVGGWTKTKLMLISTQVEVVVEIEVELGKIARLNIEGKFLLVSRLHTYILTYWYTSISLFLKQKRIL